MTNHISAEAEAARERARDHGKFGTQNLDKSSATVPATEPKTIYNDYGAGVEHVTVGDLWEDEYSSEMGDYSMGPIFSATNTWQMPTGEYVVIQDNYGVEASVSAYDWDGDSWEGIDVDTNNKSMDPGDVEKIEARIKELREALERPGMTIDRSEQIDKLLAAAPQIRYRSVNQTMYTVCSDPNDPGNTELWSDIEYDDDSAFDYPTLEEASQEARRNRDRFKDADATVFSPVNIYKKYDPDFETTFETRTSTNA